MIFIRVMVVIISLLIFQSASYGDSVTGSQVLKSQELVIQDKALRDKIEEKSFIAEIEVTGADLLSQDQIEQIILPFKKKWLSKKDLRSLEDLILQEYINIGKNPERIAVTSVVESDILKVKIVETETP